MRRAPNGGLKVLVGHHSNDYNYVVLLIRESGYITVYREYAHEYTQLAHVHYPTPIETYRTFKVNGTATWSLRTPHPHRPDAPVRSPAAFTTVAPATSATARPA
ncbi:MAG TPA: hypothetical protein VHH15_06410 [Actinophytocola sp.]|nr:hypothetical protein [Actinophytocola sp.]